MRHMFSDVALFRRDPLAFLVRRGETATEPLARLAFGFKSVYLLTDPEYVKPLLKLSEETLDKGPMMKRLQLITGENVIVLKGEEHRRRRATLLSFLTRNVVERLTPEIAAQARGTISEVGKSGTFDAREFGVSVALRMISVVAFGSNVLSAEDEGIVREALEVSMAEMADLLFRGAPPAPWTNLIRRRRIARSRLRMQQVLRRIRERAPNSIAIRGMDDLGLSEAQTADELLTFLIVGHDTTGAAATWLCHLLATVPTLADRIAAEAAAVRNESGELDVAKLPSAHTTAATVREVLRLYPPGYWLPRGICADVEFAGRKLHRGDSIIVSPWLFHRSARFWEAPDEFRLDRNHSSKAYFPFGTGPRMCVGAVLATLELEIVALELASALRLAHQGPVGAPRPWIHLAPPVMPMSARSRSVSQTYPPGNAAAAPAALAASEMVEQLPDKCPYHAGAR